MPASSNFISCLTLPCRSRTVSGALAGRVHLRRARAAMPATRQRERGKCAAARAPLRAARALAPRAAPHRARSAPLASASTQPTPYTPAIARESGERAVDLRVAAREPRKAGEDGAAQPFADRPCAREGERAVPCRRRTASRRSTAAPLRGVAGAQRHRCRRQSRIEREVQRKQHDGRAGERRGHAAVEMHADVQPPDARHEIAEAERASRSAPRFSSRWCA